MDSQLVFHHQDGDLSFDIVEGVYNVSQSGELWCSVACAPNEEHEYMASPCFALLNLPAGDGLYSRQVFIVDAQATSEDIVEYRPLAHLYAGEHYSPWNTRLTVLSVDEDSVEVHVLFTTADPNYYDARAKPTHAEFRATLKASPRAAVWNPL